MQSNRGTYILIVVAIILSIISISIAYAAYSTRLNINGYASMNLASWNIHFENLSNVYLSGNAQELVHPSITDNTTNISAFEINFQGKDDSAYYTFDIVNSGDLDAILTSLNISEPVCTSTGDYKDYNENLVCKNIRYTLTDSAGNNIAVGNTLDSGEKITVKLKLTYVGDELPYETVKISNLDISLIYSQN